MGNFNLPGVSQINPEVETHFTLCSSTGLIKMKSGDWSLTGTSGELLKDSKFKNSFDIVSVFSSFTFSR